MRKLVFIFILLVGHLTYAWGQFSMVARVDKTNLTMDDELTLTVEIRGAQGNVAMPQLPSLPSFNVYSRASNQSIINGVSTYLFQYTMLPRVTGNAKIGPVSLTYKGKTYTTDPIEVHIYRSGTQPPVAAPTSSAGNVQSDANYDSSLSVPTVETADPDLPPLERKLANQAYKRGQTENFFLIAAVSNDSPYVNETFTLAVRFYYGSSFQDNAPYQKPSVSNLFIEDIGASEGSQNIHGRLFRYSEQRYQLAGAAAGEALISSATVDFFTGSSPFALFDRMFGGAALGNRERVESAPIRLKIRPLPQGQPASFSGAVGSGFVIAAKADPTTVEAGEAVNLSVTVQGKTNLKTSKELKFPEITGFKSYPAASQTGSVKGNADRTYKVFKTVLVPSSSGIYTVPAIAWSYFDPSTTSYKTLHTQPLTLTVTPSTKVNRGVDFGAITPQDNGFQALGNDIHYLKTVYAPRPTFLTDISKWAWLNGLVLVWLAICIFSASLGKKIGARKRAYYEAKTRLKKAVTYEDISDAVAAYLAARLNIRTGSMPLREITVALQQKGYDLPTIRKFAALWQAWEAARFAPNQVGESPLAEQAKEALVLLKELENK